MNAKFRWFTVALAAMVFLSGVALLGVTWCTHWVPTTLRYEVSLWLCSLLVLSAVFGASQFKALKLIRIQINRRFIIRYPRNNSHTYLRSTPSPRI